MEKKKRGFAAMTPEKQREIASKGGKTAHERGHARQWDSTSGAEAGRKGAANRNALRQQVSS
jgi:general stress protein YciG